MHWCSFGPLTNRFVRRGALLVSSVIRFHNFEQRLLNDIQTRQSHFQSDTTEAMPHTHPPPMLATKSLSVRVFTSIQPDTASKDILNPKKLRVAPSRVYRTRRLKVVTLCLACFRDFHVLQR